MPADTLTERAALAPIACVLESQMRWNPDDHEPNAYEHGTATTKGTIVFTNRRKHSVLIYALDPVGRRMHRASIRPGGSFSQLTLRSQPWVVVERGGIDFTDRPLSIWRLADVDAATVVACIE
ncbi:hypothetical protein BKA62DRAFT_675905 [Auriculariales sp. MPI-PUGE-AT-0066]|nr:hypothetical protein BKA62DRAFT_675905 [Auriculariales sp. MPI-PUGE-AT-0066]